MSQYELLERIGAGGMAEIFRGKSVAAGGFEKPVAIKKILPHLCEDKRFVDLLISEAKILAKLRHRNIVQVFDVGLGEDKAYFVVMEYVDGVDLEQLFATLERQGERMPLDVALHIGAEVCEALDHAHRAKNDGGTLLGLVHRDVSPSNVLLSASGEVKLTDFGIAKSVEEATGHGSVRGKFAYISPEQARNIHVDSRSDAYSLAMILFELVTGRHLFSSMADFDALQAARNPEIPRIRDLDPNLPQQLDEIIAKALQPKPDSRYESAGDLGAALREMRYSLEATSGDPAASIGNLVRVAWQARGNDDLDDDAHTVLRVLPGDKQVPLDEAETRLISILDPEQDPITLTARSFELGQSRDSSDSDVDEQTVRRVAPLRGDVDAYASDVGAEGAPADPHVGSISPGDAAAGPPRFEPFSRPATGENRLLETVEDIGATAALPAAGSYQPGTSGAPRKRRPLVLIAVGIVVGVTAFGIASWLLSGSDARVAPVDAGIVAEESASDAALVPETIDAGTKKRIRPRKKIRRARSTNRSKKRRRQRRKKRARRKR